MYLAIEIISPGRKVHIHLRWVIELSTQAMRTQSTTAGSITMEYDNEYRHMSDYPFLTPKLAQELKGSFDTYALF